MSNRFIDSRVRVASAAALVVALTGCTGGEKGSGVAPSGSGGESAASGGGSRGDGGSDASQTGSGVTSGDGGAGATTVGVTVTSTATSTSATTTTSSVTSSTSTGGGGQVAEVYAQSATTLYRVDLESNQVETIGDFSGCGGDVIDIALDKDSQMYGTTNGGLYRIDRTNAACTFVASGTFPNSLSFVPAGTLDPTEEQLVGYVDADYVRIDTVSGAVQTLASSVLPNGLISSGDIVSVIDGPTLLTVKGGACEPADCVVEIDPATGEVLVDHGTVTYQNVFGIAYWDGSLYGFTSYGEAFQLLSNGGGGFDVVSIPVLGGESFYGAGSTTAAPPGVFN